MQSKARFSSKRAVPTRVGITKRDADRNAALRASRF